MAGDWIKMRTNLWDDPRVSKLCDMTGQIEATMVGALYWLWSAADAHTEDGVMPGLSLSGIDRKTGIKGFGSALLSIGWLVDHPEGVRIVRFVEHNGQSAKRRCSESRRKMSARDADGKQTESGTCAEESQQECAPREDVEKNSKPHSIETTSTTTTEVQGKPSESSLSSSAIDKRAKTFAKRLDNLETARGRKVTASPIDPRIQAWSRQGVTDAQWREAYEQAVTQRINDRDISAVNPGFLDVFIAKLLNPPPDAKSAVIPEVSKEPDLCSCCKAPASKRIGRDWYCSSHDQYSTTISKASDSLRKRPALASVGVAA